MNRGVTFIPGDPPRRGLLAVWPEPGGEEVELVVPTRTGARRAHVRARLIPMTDVIAGLQRGDLSDTSDASRAESDGHGMAIWDAVARTGLQLIARGRLLPTASSEGWDAWRVGPLDPADIRRLDALAAAMPAAAHAIPIAGTRPLRIRSAATLIRAFWDALADTLVRTAGAEATSDHAAFAATEPTNVEHLHDWLATADRSLDARARPGLRLELPDGPDGEFCAVLQLRSTSDHSLVIDAADLWDAPGAVLSRMGDDADTDLLLALRRGAHVWPPLKRLLDVARPERLALDDAETEDLLGAAAESLAAAGIEVLWPAEFAVGGITLKAVIRTEAPAPVTAAGLTLPSLLQFDWQAALGEETLTERELAELAEAKRPLVRLRGKWVTVDPTVLERLRRRRPRPLTPAEALAAALSGQIRVDGDPVTFQADGVLADVVRRMSEPREIPIPEGLHATLRPYQQRGLAWLDEMAALGVGGCLADDMGLGKTVQLIALHLARRNTPPSKPTLVICPTSLLGNWERETNRFAPSIPVRRFHGGARNLDDLEPDAIVLATYGVVRRDRELLQRPDWGLVVADEAQHVKNPLSGTARALRTIRGDARIALTGTPVENRLTELWAILDWTTPGLLGPLETFRRQVAVPVERYHDPDATERLARIVRPFLLRRRKSDPNIAPELPPKTETDVVVPLSAEQVTLYEAVVRETMAQIAEAEGIARRGLVLKLLTELKQVCNHPAQFLHQDGPLGGRSGKLAALDELLGVIVDEGESVLVFTQYVQMARLLLRHIEHSHATGTQLLDGSVPARRREQMVDRFQAGEVPVFILSLRAGGTGLNLTRATHVVHYDRWWNPAVEDQASDRAYRIGQDRPVQVHRLIAEGTLEDRIAAVLAGKRELAERVVGGGEAWLSELSDDELASLVSLGNLT